MKKLKILTITLLYMWIIMLIPANAIKSYAENLSNIKKENGYLKCYIKYNGNTYVNITKDEKLESKLYYKDGRVEDLKEEYVDLNNKTIINMGQWSKEYKIVDLENGQKRNLMDEIEKNKKILIKKYLGENENNSETYIELEPFGKIGDQVYYNYYLIREYKDKRKHSKECKGTITSNGSCYKNTNMGYSGYHKGYDYFNLEDKFIEFEDGDLVLLDSKCNEIDRLKGEDDKCTRIDKMNNSNNIYFKDDGGIWKISIENNKFHKEKLKLPKDAYTKMIFSDSKGELWIYDYSKDNLRYSKIKDGKIENEYMFDINEPCEGNIVPFMYDENSLAFSGWHNNFIKDNNVHKENKSNSKWCNNDGKWLYLNGDGFINKGWKTINNLWYYFDKSGYMQTGWKVVNGKWYKFDNSGAMKDNWYKEGNNWYYLEGGAMQTGWKVINGKWYKFDNSGTMKDNWYKEGNAWYYLEGGVMQTGWKVINGKWYKFDNSGAMKDNWYKEGNAWYYLEGGAMQTGWKVINGKWYKFDNSGAMKDNWYKEGNKWYYLEGGAMQTGWKKINNNWYYFNDSGVMITNTEINGWKIDNSGIAREN